MGAALLVAAGVAHAAEDVSVEAVRRGDSIDVEARATIAAPLELIWRTLSDYEGLPAFIPGMARSVVRQRAGARVVVEQSGEARFLFFSFPIEVQLEVFETPPQRITSRAIAGNLKRMTGRYDIVAVAQGAGVPAPRFQLRYAGSIEPQFELPPLIGVAAMRGMVDDQFVAMVAEIERRAAAGR